MHFHSFTLIAMGALALQVAASPKGKEDDKAAHNGTAAHNSTHHVENQTMSDCFQYDKATVLTDIANNATKKAEFLAHAKNQTKAQDELTAAPAKAQSLAGNATLMSACQVINAHEKLKAQCGAMKMLTKLSDASTNATLKQEIMSKAKNATRVNDEIEKAPAKLKTLQSNSSLVSECSTLEKSKKNGTDGTDKGTSSSSGAESLAVGKMSLVLLATTFLGAITLF